MGLKADLVVGISLTNNNNLEESVGRFSFSDKTMQFALRKTWRVGLARMPILSYRGPFFVDSNRMVDADQRRTGFTSNPFFNVYNITVFPPEVNLEILNRWLNSWGESIK